MSKKKYFDIYDDYPYNPAKNDQNGYNLSGYYRARYIHDGYDQYGIDKYGFDKNGYDSERSEKVITINVDHFIDFLHLKKPYNAKILKLKGKLPIYTFKMKSIIEFVAKNKLLEECNFINIGQKPEKISPIFSFEVIQTLQSNEGFLKAIIFVMDKSVIDSSRYINSPIKDYEFLQCLQYNKCYINQMLSHLPDKNQKNANLWYEKIVISQFCWLSICKDAATNGGDFANMPIETVCKILSFVLIEKIELIGTSFDGCN